MNMDMDIRVYLILKKDMDMGYPFLVLLGTKSPAA